MRYLCVYLTKTNTMKKGLTYGLSAIIGLSMLIGAQRVSAAIDARIGFEKAIPEVFSCASNSRIELSDKHFKDGEQSLRWSWSTPSQLIYTDAVQFARSMNTWNAGLMLWVYNPKAADSDMRFSLETADGATPYFFDFHMDFTGWRACWIKYDDMPGDHASKQITRLVISTPQGVDSGELFLDRMSVADFRLHDQITPDQQIADNNKSRKRDLWHWCRLWEWEQNVHALPLTDPTSEQFEMLRTVDTRIGELVTAELPGQSTITRTLIPRALALYQKAGIGRTPDGRITGAPLLSDDECNTSKGEMRLTNVESMLHAFALNNYVNKDKQYDNLFFNVFDYAIDQGFAFGSGMGTNHHYGYAIRKIFDAAWLMRPEIARRGKTDEYARVLAYWSGLAETRQPYAYGRDELLDAWHTLLPAKLKAIALIASNNERLRAMRSLGVWLSGSLDFTPGTIGGIKPDGTTFHHGGLYPAYSVGAFAALGEFCKVTAGTEFIPTEAARRNLKLALQTLDRYTNHRDWGLGICGRHPLSANGRIPDADVNAFGYLALLGDLTGKGGEIDTELAGDYLRLGGTDKLLTAILKQDGIAPTTPPQGFFVCNYGALGIHRRDDWMVALKAYNSDVWSAEIYTRDNRFGRYQSYGSVQIVGSGSPVTAQASGFSQEGWDWNLVPGATTIHLPYEKLNSPLPGTLMEKSPVRFSGTSSLEGRNGVMAFHLIEGSRENFSPGATARKSVFCFDNRLVMLGSDISNDNADYPTQTTLYQLRLDNTADAIEVDGKVLTDFPLAVSKKDAPRLVLSDTKGNYYVVKNAANVVIAKQEQTSPNDKTLAPQTGRFVTAVLDHGKAPKNRHYEYAVYIKPAPKEVQRLAKKEDYQVLRRDSTAHVVRDNASGTTGYVCFGEYTGTGLVQRVSTETILMERTDGNQLVMSVCTPDLGLAEKAYTTRQPGQPIEKEVLLEDDWLCVSPDPAVTAVRQGGGTLLRVTCRDGLPVEFRLRKR